MRGHPGQRPEEHFQDRHPNVSCLVLDFLVGSNLGLCRWAVKFLGDPTGCHVGIGVVGAQASSLGTNHCLIASFRARFAEDGLDLKLSSLNKEYAVAHCLIYEFDGDVRYKHRESKFGPALAVNDVLQISVSPIEFGLDSVVMRSLRCSCNTTRASRARVSRSASTANRSVRCALVARNGA